MKNLIIRVLLIISFTSISDEVELDKAITVAQNFVLTELDLTDETMSLIDSKLITLSDNTETIAYYIFNFNSSAGFIIISGQDITHPILGYSTSSTYNANNIPNNFNNWMNQYTTGIIESLENNVVQDMIIETKWNNLVNGLPLTLFRSNMAVDPLLTTTWDQGSVWEPYYNALCPGGSVTGCVATAMAQIMNYWEYPSSGTGFHSYNEDDYGTLSVNFSNTTYDWANMPNNVTSPNTAVATLMYHCGVSVNMNYSPEVSGAWVLDDFWTDASVETALPTYFDYNANTIGGIKRENYNSTNWIQALKNELNEGRPMEYAGYGTDSNGNTSGHAFVCDGYDNLNYFHFNWGWGGWYDGFFLVDNLNPNGTGTGGGSGAYNDGQQALIGVQPNQANNGTVNADINLAVYSDVSIENNPTYYANEISLTVDVANYGGDTFEGDLCAALFNESGVFIDYIEILTDIELGSNYYNTYTFVNDFMLSALPGNYNIGIYYRPTESDWMWVSENGSYSNWEPFSVINPNTLELYSCLSLSSDTLIEGESISIDFNVYNSGGLCGDCADQGGFYCGDDPSNWTQYSPYGCVQSSWINDGYEDCIDASDENGAAATTISNCGSISGIYDLSLYDLSTGEWLLQLGSVEALDLSPGYVYTNDFSIYSFPINLSPGTYLLAGMYLESGSDDWQLFGASYCSNPIELVVLETPVEPDMYEYNNTPTDAYVFYPNFINNQAEILTLNSNIHNSGMDQDFYKIELDENYTYSMNARAHDLANSGNSYEYTNDVLWSYKRNDDDSWSTTYGDIMSENIIIENGGSIIFSISSLFLGQEGTYLFDVQIERTAIILGCTDPTACNYDSSATDNDGSCYNNDLGCGCDAPAAITGYDCDGSCLADADGDGVCDEFEIEGCTDSTACNYDSSATDDDSSCTFAEASLDCDGNCLADLDGDGVCDEFEIEGCTDFLYEEYNPDATDDDGSCLTLSLEGCVDPESCNYNPDATDDDGSCVYAQEYYDCNGVCLNDTDDDGTCDELEIEGCVDPESCNYNPDATDDDGSCVYAQEYYDCNGVCLNDTDDDGACDELEIEGCTDFLYEEYNPDATDDDGSCLTLSLEGCMDSESCNYNPDAIEDDGSCVYAQEYYDCNGVCLNDTDDDGVCDELEIGGCTNPTAYNYNPDATDDDGSCIAFIYGCTDAVACNYDLTANTDDGSCVYADTGYDCDGNCIEDLDNDSICDDCENWTYVVVDCECEFVDPNTYTVLFTTVEEEDCEIWEDCECECYNDIDNNGICDENENSATFEELSNQKYLIKTVDILGRENCNARFQLNIYNDGSVQKEYLLQR